MPAAKVDRRPLISYLKVQKAADQRILAILRATSTSIDRDLARLKASQGIGAAVRADQLRLAQAEINRKLAAAWTEVGNTVEAGRAAAAAAAVEASMPTSFLKAVLPDADVDYMLKSAQQQAARGIETLQARLDLSQIPLAESVYNNKALSNGTIDSIVNAGLASGASAAEIASKVRAYINPNTPGGVKYASMRLGRTELNNAFHAQQVQEGIKTPWTTALKWNLSGSHPVPDECNQYAESTHFEGGGAGEFKPDQIPAKPHPNCLCYTTPVTDDRDEFIRKLEAGHYDDYLDEEFGLDPSSRFTSAAPPAPRVDVTPSTRVRSGVGDHADLSRSYSSWMQDNASTVQTEAFQRYTTTSAYQKWNPHLRGQAADVSEKDLQHIKAMQDMIDSSPPTTSPLDTFRGIKDPDAVFGPEPMKAGSSFTDNAFVSTTMDDSILEYYKGAEAGGAHISIRVPTGTRVGVAETEGQVVLGQGTNFRVVSDRMVTEVVNQADYDYLAGQGLSPAEFQEKLKLYKVTRTYRKIELEVV